MNDPAASRSTDKQPYRSAAWTLVSSHPVDSLAECGQILFDNEPDRREVHAQVAMHNHIAESGEFPPRNLWFGTLDFARQTLAGFGKGLKIADNRVLHQTRCVKVSALGIRLIKDAVHALAHVRQQHTV